RQVVDRLGQALQHRPDADDIGAALHGFVGGITGVQIREHQYRRLAGYRAVRRFAAGHAGGGGGVILQRAVNNQIGAQLTHQFGGGADFFHIGTAAGFAGTVTDHGNARTDAHGQGRFRTLNGNISPLFGIRVGVNRTVAGYQSVDFVLGQHHGAQHHVIFQLRQRHGFGQLFVFAQLNHAGDVVMADAGGVQNLQPVGQFHFVGLGYLDDAFRVSQ